MGQALYRTYRSKKLSEIVGQEHITTALTHALKNGTISHAYLFTGPRGVGKTSIARILAHEINHLPYLDDAAPHLDIIEIDAASNRRIDEIRDLRDKVHIAPTSAQYKVYIIDEVHMLTKEAFNALLKTLEEPPAHVVFILATTEAHKLPETIVSRTQRFGFKPVELSKVVAHLREIAQKEKIKIDDAALELIAAHGEGSFRDSISLLDQVRNHAGTVTLASVQQVLGIAPAELIAALLTALQAHDAVRLTGTLQQMQEQGHEPAQIAKQLGQSVRQAVLDGADGLTHDVSMKLLGQLVQVPASHDPQIALEIALLDAALSGAPLAPVKPVAPVPKPLSHTSTPKVMHQNVQAVPAAVEPHPSAFRSKAAEPEPAAATPAANNTGAAVDEQSWASVLARLKQSHNTLFSIARMAQAAFEPDAITLAFQHGFHQKRLNEKRNKELLAAIVQEVTGQTPRIICVVSDTPAGPTPAQAAAPPPTVQPEPITPPTAAAADPLSTVSNIFAGAELLES